MPVKILSSTLVILTVLFLTACGYHLRGAIDLPSEMKTVYLEGASAPLVEQFKKALGSSTVQLVNSRAAAGTIILVSNEDTLKNASSLGASGRANQYNLVYRLNYEITDANNAQIVKSQPIEIRREYFNDQQLILGKDNEEIVIRNEMYQQAVRTMINQVRTGLKK
ncbi:MAG: LPS assembly lipoprotein LptE [Methylococcaceae bacterium]|nr:LPS assembly lipoprotein LptE [Methylococcaceae bacterium]MDD1608576.1 LPS assembly lipoprotein LptE [Methylococcaceae bacterium]MDD1610332.1 LPS assembly lipoprotein LptE [Methylococcaceae bacterium]MDD1616589.1 LPS assembly lipoprotein LptE [Methylococcaceae bacterium]OYV17374.1 MAG: LPS-assembly lipoprotein [Methylococcaceae bacterium NSP1-2]